MNLQDTELLRTHLNRSFCKGARQERGAGEKGKGPPSVDEGRGTSGLSRTCCRLYMHR